MLPLIKTLAHETNGNKGKNRRSLPDYTIDDFYVNHKVLLELPKRKFLEITGLKDEAEIQNFLENTILKNNPRDIEQTLNELKSKALTTEEGIKKRQRNISGYEKKILAIEKEQQSIPAQESNLKEEIYSLEKEIEYLKPIGVSTGVLLDKTYWDIETYFQSTELGFSHLDKSAFLALKISLSANHFIITQEDIALTLTGGLLASITFRKKGDLISKFQQSPRKIFALAVKGFYHLDPRGQNGVDRDQIRTSIHQTLYHQAGYADSTLQIETPIGYYLLLDEYVVEIRFHPASILIGANDVVRAVPEISSKAKRAEEIWADEKERQRQEEEEWYD